MRKNSFEYGMAIICVIIGIVYIIGSLGDNGEARCINPECNKYRTTDSSYCFVHEPYVGSSYSGSSTTSTLPGSSS